MDYYVEVSKDNKTLMKYILDTIDKYEIKELRDWYDCYREGIDGYLVNMVYNIIDQMNLYKKSDIIAEFNNCFTSLRSRVGGLKREGLEDIFNSIWDCIYQKNYNDKRKIKDWAFKKQPIWRRIVNSNKFLLFYAILLILALSFVIGEYSVVNICLIYLLMILYGMSGIVKAYVYTLFCIGVFCMLVILFEGDYAASIKICRYSIYCYLFNLLWIPVIMVNHERLNDK